MSTAPFLCCSFWGDLTAQWRETHLMELLPAMEHQAMVLAATPVGQSKLP